MKRRIGLAIVIGVCWTEGGDDLRAADTQPPPAQSRDGISDAGQREADRPPPAAQKIVEQGLFPKSIAIPGTDVSLSVGGYVKVDFIQDVGSIQDAFEFKTSSIPADGSAAASHSGRTTIHARETRINLDLRSDASRLPFRAFVEGDFFGDGNGFRMRRRSA